MHANFAAIFKCDFIIPIFIRSFRVVPFQNLFYCVKLCGS